MAGIFISHSSVDKSFVHRLAIDLVVRNMPVWFDTWEMDTGDSLYQKIYEGIEASDYVIVVLSPSSVASRWVQKELAAALTLEERRGRKFILPIRIAECDIPLALGDRLYADFSASYLEPLERLVSRLSKLGLSILNEPPEHALVPLVFEKGIYLDSVQLERRIRSLQPRLPDEFKFAFDQLIVAPDERYDELRHRLIYRKEHIEDDPYYTPAFSRDFNDRYNGFLELERRLIEGIQLIVNGYITITSPVFDVGDSSYWFARNIRSQILYLLWSSQNPDLSNSIDFGKDCEPLPFSTDRSAARFLEVNHVEYISVGPRDEKSHGLFPKLADSKSIAIDADSSAFRFVKDAIVCHVKYLDDLYSKYLVPQLVARHLANPNAPFTLTFDDWYASLR